MSQLTRTSLTVMFCIMLGAGGLNVVRQSDVFASHIFTVPSLEAEITRVPSPL